MIRAIQTPSGEHAYALTKRGVIGLLAGSSVALTTLILVIIAFHGQHSNAERTEALSASNQTLIASLQDVVGRQDAQLADARDAYCRLKGYETLSGNAVLRIAIHFKLLNPREQRAWREALTRVHEIPAASRCSSTPIALRSPAKISGGESGVAVTLLPGLPPSPIPRHSPSTRSRQSHARPKASTPVSPIAPAPAPSPSAPGTPVLNPAGHAPPGLQPSHKGHG